MLKKITALMILMGASAISAQNFYKTDNYTVWRVLGANVENKYLIVEAKDESMLNQFKPLCTNSSVWIFSYQMMGFDDAFYDAQSEPRNLKYLRKSADYVLKIDIEPDTIYSGKPSTQRICSENQAQPFFSEQNNKHGVVTYAGDENITPPF